MKTYTRFGQRQIKILERIFWLQNNIIDVWPEFGWKMMNISDWDLSNSAD